MGSEKGGLFFSLTSPRAVGALSFLEVPMGSAESHCCVNYIFLWLAECKSA